MFQNGKFVSRILRVPEIVKERNEKKNLKWFMYSIISVKFKILTFRSNNFGMCCSLLDEIVTTEIATANALLTNESGNNSLFSITFSVAVAHAMLLFFLCSISTACSFLCSIPKHFWMPFKDSQWEITVHTNIFTQHRFQHMADWCYVHRSQLRRYTA